MFQSSQVLQVSWVLGSSWSLNIGLTWAEIWGKPHPWGQELGPNSQFGMRLEFWLFQGSPKSPQRLWGRRNVLDPLQCCF